MNVRPLAWSSSLARARFKTRLRWAIRDAAPGVAVTLISCGLLVYGCAGRDSLRPPEPPDEPVLAVAPEPEPVAEPVVAKAERQLFRVRPSPPRASLKRARRAAAFVRAIAPQPAPAAAEPAPPKTESIATPAIARTAPAARPERAKPPTPASPAIPTRAPPAIPTPAPPAIPTPAPAVTAVATAALAAPPAPQAAPPIPPPSTQSTLVAEPAPAPRPPPPKKRVDRKKRPTPMSPQDATHHLAVAWEQITGEPATIEVVSVLWAQWALETGRGRWMVDYNYAGLKGRAPDGGLSHWWTWEETDEGARRVRARFRSYATPTEGALDYIQLLIDRYPRAIAAARQGNAVSFVLELDQGGFFTERPKHYVASVASLAIEFRREHRAARF